MACNPAGCVVVEDGVLGARAGRLAGMDVLGYADSDDRGRRLAQEGARTFESMTELPALLGLGRWSIPRPARSFSPPGEFALSRAIRGFLRTRGVTKAMRGSRKAREVTVP
jgi:hypothetical protein